MEITNSPFIEVMKPVDPVEGWKKDTGPEKTDEFPKLLESLWNNAGDTRAEYANQQYLLSVGETEDPHNMMIAAGKAELATDLLVQVRNKAMEAYDQLIKTGI